MTNLGEPPAGSTVSTVSFDIEMAAFDLLPLEIRQMLRDYPAEFCAYDTMLEIRARGVPAVMAELHAVLDRHFPGFTPVRSRENAGRRVRPGPRRTVKHAKRRMAYPNLHGPHPSEADPVY